ncbi:MAG: hypothetical protein WDZ35_01900 [Crocinitomicaceae bacterium]
MNDIYPQFAVFDFDDDSIDEVYINISDPYYIHELPVELTEKGIYSQRVILNYKENQLHIEKHVFKNQIINPDQPHWSQVDNSDIELR